MDIPCINTLIVEEDLVSRTLLQELLEHYGPVQIAENCDAALDVVRRAIEISEHCALVCLDAMQLGMDGQQTIAKIRAMELDKGILPASGAKIIITAAALSDREAILATYAGLCDACLVKPVTKANLEPVLARWGWATDSGPPLMRILIAEDDPTSRAILRKFLEDAPGMDLVEAEDGQSAWLLLEKGLLPDLCIIDNLMPNLSGLELLEKMRQDIRLRDVPVIFCTSVSDRATVASAAKLNIRAYLLKPIVPDAVLEKVESLRKEIGAAHERRRKHRLK